MNAEGSCGSRRTGSCHGRLSTPAANLRAQGCYHNLTPSQEGVAKHLLTSLFPQFMVPHNKKQPPPPHLPHTHTSQFSFPWFLQTDLYRSGPGGRRARAQRPSMTPLMSSPSALLIAPDVIWHPKTSNGQFGAGGIRREGMKGVSVVTQVHKLAASHVANE